MNDDIPQYETLEEEDAARRARSSKKKTGNMGNLPTWAWVVMVLAAFAVFVTIGYLNEGKESTDSAERDPIRLEDFQEGGSACIAITYEVDGSTYGASVTLQNSEGGTEQHESIKVPGRAGGGCFAPGEFAYLAAQNNADYGSITCRILADGVVIEETTSSGAYVIATCSGSL